MTEGIINEDTSIAALTREAGNAALSLWSEEKKKDFVATFRARARCTRYLLVRTALALIDLAKSRRYISDKHTNRAEGLPRPNDMDACCDPVGHGGYTYHETRKAGGRPVTELRDLATKRADAILRELPPIRTATQVILPDIAKKMERRDALLEKGKMLMEKLEETNSVAGWGFLEMLCSGHNAQKMSPSRCSLRRGAS